MEIAGRLFSRNRLEYEVGRLIQDADRQDTVNEKRVGDTDQPELYDEFAQNVKTIVRQRYLERLEDLETGCRYWESISRSGPAGIGLHAVQLAPRWVAAGLVRVAHGEPFAALLKLEKRAKLRQLSDPKTVVAYAKRQWRLVDAHLQLSHETLQAERDALYEALGLLCEDLSDNSADQVLERVVTSVSTYAETMQAQLDSTSQPAHQMDVKEALNCFLANDKRLGTVLAQYQGPSRLERYWPLLLVALYGSWRILGSWREIVEWTRTNILDTAESFVRNWVWEPLVQVYRTVRHDENSRVALMAKASLDSDLKSLERMVVDYARDNGSAADLDAVRAAVAHGDLSAVMMPYEQQLHSPISSLVRGHLVRSLLIQVQKTKVDVEVAMDGIDKMLQSQQLVFGIVAALPALGVSWAAVSYFVSSSRAGGNKRRFQNLARSKSRLRTRLLMLDRILRHSGETSHEKRCGEVLYLTWKARLAGQSYLSHDNYKFLAHDLRVIEEDIYVDPDQVVSDLDRIFLHGYF